MPRTEGHELDPMNLIPQSEGLKAGHGAAECQPPAHHLSDRLLAPEAKIEIAPSDAGDDAIPLAPIGDLKTWDGSGDTRFPAF
jgi:hypothetical protein